MPAQRPFYGPITADYDWCENNYAVTPYVAEFFNALSSVTIVLAGVYWERRTLRYGYGLRWHVASAGLVSIGLGSIAFHGTLLRWAQVLDEVPMLWSALAYLWISVCAMYFTERETEERYGPPLAVLLTLIGACSTFCYFSPAYGGFAFFIVTYAVTVAITAILTLYRAVGKEHGRLALYAVLCYAGGFALLWLPEQLLCGNRLEVSHDSGLLRLTVPLHAYFHVTSAAGPIFFLSFVLFHQLKKERRRPQLFWRAAWEALGLWAPEVEAELPKAEP